MKTRQVSGVLDWIAAGSAVGALIAMLAKRDWFAAGWAAIALTWIFIAMMRRWQLDDLRLVLRMESRTRA